MLKIRDRTIVPPGLYDYTVPETKTTFQAHGFGLLLVKVREHMEANNIAEPESLSRIIEEDWCKRREDFCEDTENPRPRGTASGEWNSLQQLIATATIGGADALAAISKALGIDCKRCQKRHKIIQEMRRLGFAETMKRLKETLHA